MHYISYLQLVNNYLGRFVIIICYIMCLANGNIGATAKPHDVNLSNIYHNHTNEKTNAADTASINLKRSIALFDTTISRYFDSKTLEMKRFYNPFTLEASDERASVWMYTSGIEALNAILHGLIKARESGDEDLFNLHYERYIKLLESFYDNADYYLGTFQLTSYTQTREWSVYAVDRVNEKGKANVSGILNVYDDQMWLIRELLDSYKLTGKRAYLNKAEYLMTYVLDGWDATFDEKGNEVGGITWGPGYTTKHACSNGPLVSSLVWLYELYNGKNDQVEHRFINPNDRKTRMTSQIKKSQYYLDFAKKVYQWQKENLLRPDGVFADMMGGCVPDCNLRSEVVDGITYRASTKLTEAVGQAFSYNTATMISGAFDLLRVTDNREYASDLKSFTQKSFAHFAKLGKDIPSYYSFDTDGFNNWFNGILLRSYYDASKTSLSSPKYLDTFQKNLDYGFKHFNKSGLLPTDLLVGWDNKQHNNRVEGMFMFTYAAQYAILAQKKFQSTSEL